MTIKPFITTSLLASLLLLAACTQRGYDTPTPVSTGPQVLSADQIRTAFSGKSWKWSNTTNGKSGMTIYAADGGSLIEVFAATPTGRSISSKGTWSTRDGELCETIAPGPISPGGSPLSCKKVTASGSGYQVGQALFTPS